ncbi:MAG: alpha-2-macroglobulin [Thermoleophilia bacterium]|nr:alpha-2-macroglobulin [Thermoleophilia bacterium]
MSRLRLLVPFVLIVLLAASVLACDEAGDPVAAEGTISTMQTVPTKADGYVALVPSVLRSGETASFSFTLTDGEKPGSGTASVTIFDKGKIVAQGASPIEDTGSVEFDLPVVAAGDYDVLVKAAGFSDSTKVRVEAGTLLFLETDKPIYKPGQTIELRLVALNGELRPVQTEATVETQDAKGIKIFKKTLTTDEYGMATTQLPLSAEPNLGVWKISASAGDASTELDVRIERYVLPKYEVTPELTKDWFLVNEPIKGHVTTKYSYGRAVEGELKITATRYVGQWEEYATYTAPIDGEGDFTIEPAEYVAGVAEAGGNGNVKLDITVVENSTGYEQTTTELVTVADSPVTLQLIPESSAFKPTLPFSLLVVTETPSGDPVEAAATINVYYYDEDYEQVGKQITRTVETKRGTGLAQFTPPKKAVRMTVDASAGGAYTYNEITSSYSPSGNFIHVQQQGDLNLQVGDTASFTVASTAEAKTFYYEVVARGRVVFTSSTSDEVSFKVTPIMAPSAQLLVYQILPNSEVAADTLPFDVTGDYPHEVSASFDVEEAKPGDKVEVQVQTEGPAKVGLVAVDHSVFILAENRLNLEQVFAELEALYMQPQVELHEAEWMGGTMVIPGAVDTFRDAGLTVLSNKKVPEGKEIESPMRWAEDAGMLQGLGMGDGMAKEQNLAPATTAAAATRPGGSDDSGGLAEVQRVRQFFPETWIWAETLTDGSGKAILEYDAPDSITNWDLRAVAVSPEHGLGIAEASLTVFQPFFLSADLPYSAIRGEEFPVKIALYNYLDTPQKITVEIEEAGWFELLDDPKVTVTVAGGDIGSAEFRIRPKTIGTQLVEISARSADAADAVIKSMIVEPEGVSRETVENVVVPAGETRTLNLMTLSRLQPVPDSERAYVAVTGSLLAQTIEGLDQLLQMPFGCGEQNMILFAPDAFILEYLKATRQLKPEIQAKAEMLLITGYQRELTYRHNDGSFSAFGESDESGSLWLTAFVLKSFSQAKDLTFIDEAVLSEAADWITGHQQPDGSFEAVGFVCHTDMMGGVQGKDTLTAYVAIALMEAGYDAAAGKAIAYLEGRLDDITDVYGLALTTYALELAKSGKAGQAMDALMELAVEDEEGLHWTAGPAMMLPSHDVEATGYATLALIESNDRISAAQSAKWLVGQRNSQGGFGTTQDTVVALQALIEYATLGATDTNMTVTVAAGDVTKDVKITPENFDVTQVVEVPAGEVVKVTAKGKGEAVVQGVLRYNLPEAEGETSVFDIRIDYDTDQVAVNDLIDIDVSITFDPPQPIKAGMTVLDISVPTGFAAVEDSLESLLTRPNIKRYEIAGRKVIVYIEDMDPGDTVSFSFQAVALYPVSGKGAASTVYSYYTPDWRGETVSAALSVQ